MGKIQPTPPMPPKHKLRLPKDFLPIEEKLSFLPLINYLRRKRGFSLLDIFSLTYDYDIRFCRSGPYGRRIIFPVYHKEALRTWTGRTISGSNLRYKTLSDQEDKARAEGYPPALGPISDYLLWYDKLREEDAHTIIVTEGPFDALKIMALGRRRGIVATCLFTNRPSIAQTDLLYRLLPRFKHRFLMLDQGMLHTMLRMSSKLSALKIRPLYLPSGIKDPGDLTREALDKILNKSQRTKLLLFAKA